jgi:hypothetical protein
MDKQTAKLAVILLNGYRNRFAEYEEECAEYARQGYRPHYCIHGTNQWTDYDNICGGCEDGENYWSLETFGPIAIREAKEAMEEMGRRISLYIELDRQGAPIEFEKFAAWVSEPVERIKRSARVPIYNS